MRRCREILTAIWGELSETYGGRHTSQYGTAPSLKWVSTLQAYSEAEIRRGLDRHAAKGTGWPATLDELVAAIRQPTPPEHKPFPTALPKPKSVKGHAKWRAEMVARGLLK